MSASFRLPMPVNPQHTEFPAKLLGEGRGANSMGFARESELVTSTRKRQLNAVNGHQLLRHRWQNSSASPRSVPRTELQHACNLVWHRFNVFCVVTGVRLSGNLRSRVVKGMRSERQPLAAMDTGSRFLERLVSSSRPRDMTSASSCRQANLCMS